MVGAVCQLIGEVERLQKENEKLNATLAALKVENGQLKDEIGRLKGLPPRPPIKPSGMEKAPDRPAAGEAERCGCVGAAPSRSRRVETEH